MQAVTAHLQTGYSNAPPYRRAGLATGRPSLWQRPVCSPGHPWRRGSTSAGDCAWAFGGPAACVRVEGPSCPEKKFMPDACELDVLQSGRAITGGGRPPWGVEQRRTPRDSGRTSAGRLAHLRPILQP
eukprot:scaffold7218_cov613-Prasinococcus_capsulatus_cf.AAC.2